MVIEAKPKGATKGTAIRSFMAEPPFRGRVPIFAGDDVTDEDGFAVAAELGGAGIKVGAGETRARHRVPSVAALAAWLAASAAAAAET
jgi:trehalose 6-phosphate phosphatase